MQKKDDNVPRALERDRHINREWMNEEERQQRAKCTSHRKSDVVQFYVGAIFIYIIKYAIHTAHMYGFSACIQPPKLPSSIKIINQKYKLK